jgi:hypothetical protein
MRAASRITRAPLAYRSAGQFSDRIWNSRIPLVITPARLKLLHESDQWHSARESTLLLVDTVKYVGPLKVNSTYLVNAHRNLCARNDYQNLGVNGARAGAMNDTIQAGLSRHPTTDQPMVLLYALIGTVRVFGKKIHSRMPLDPTHVRLKRTRV